MDTIYTKCLECGYDEFYESLDEDGEICGFECVNCPMEYDLRAGVDLE
jgi:uncharacterized protein YuzE